MLHILKTDSDCFQDVYPLKRKLFEVRFDDRDFKVDDSLFLVETLFTAEQMKNGSPLEFTGYFVVADIIYKFDGGKLGLEKGWCILGITISVYGDDYEPKDDDKMIKLWSDCK